MKTNQNGNSRPGEYRDAGLRPAASTPADARAIERINLFARRSLRGGYECDDAWHFYVSDILEHPQFRSLNGYYHHWNTTYGHSLLVSRIAFRAGWILSRFVPIDLRSLARGSLLHDFFLYDWHAGRPPSGRPGTGRLHAFEHPREALKNSNSCFPGISATERDIILKHMWPLCAALPKRLETLIVLIVDKLVATYEVFMELSHGRDVRSSSK